MSDLQGGSYEGEWRGGQREGIGIRTLRSGKVMAGTPSANPCLRCAHPCLRCRTNGQSFCHSSTAQEICDLKQPRMLSLCHNTPYVPWQDHRNIVSMLVTEDDMMH